MKYPIDFTGFKEQELILTSSGFFSGPKLLVDGQPAPIGIKRGEFVLTRDDGIEVVAKLKITNFLDPVPQLIINEKLVKVVEPLTWYQLIWSGLPLLLVFIGGLSGGLAGGAAVAINGRIFRTQINEVLKYVIIGMISITSLFAYMVLAMLFSLLIQGM